MLLLQSEFRTGNVRLSSASFNATNENCNESVKSVYGHKKGLLLTFTGGDMKIKLHFTGLCDPGFGIWDGTVKGAK